MKEKVIKNIVVTLVVFGLFYSYIALNNYSKEYIKLNFYYPFLTTLLSILLPITLGFIISLRIESIKLRRKVDLPKLIIQGLPALILGINWNIVVFMYMGQFGIEQLDLWIFNDLMMKSALYQPLISPLAGVWFGKVLADCFFNNDTRAKKEENAAELNTVQA